MVDAKAESYSSSQQFAGLWNRYQIPGGAEEMIPLYYKVDDDDILIHGSKL
jgi:hypothetical protein